MAATELLCTWLGLEISKLSRGEIWLLEGELLAHVCNELKETFREQNRDYFYLMRFTKEMEDIMLDAQFVRLILNDILSTNEYNLTGIAYYTNTHEDVIQEVLDGRNTNPSAILLRRSIDLHRLIRCDLYFDISKKLRRIYSSNYI